MNNYIGFRKPRIRQLFNDIAKNYDRLNHVMSFGIDRSWRRKAVREIVDDSKPIRVLDVATGTGDFAIAIAKKVQVGSVIVGIDLSEKMLEVGRVKVLKNKSLQLVQTDEECIKMQGKLQDNEPEKLLGERVEGENQVETFQRKESHAHQESSETRVNVVLQHGDVEAIDFEDDSFERVSVAFGVRNFEHLERGLSEMRRVLRPGGKLVILELSYPDNHFILWCYKLYALHFLPFIGGLISGHKEAYEYLPKSILAFPKADKFVPLLQQVGFSKVTVRKFTFGTCLMYIAE